DAHLQALALGKAVIRRKGRAVAILVFGTLLKNAQIVAESLDATVVDMRFVKPLDEELLQEMAASHDLLVTLEENVVSGGAGSAVNEYLLSKGCQTQVLNLGLPDRFIGHGKVVDQQVQCNLHSDGILDSVRQRLQTLE
ncbi:MAG: transketolase C-terminal domain-containing protein, partial [Pseudohongiellaceae bacterium]